MSQEAFAKCMEMLQNVQEAIEAIPPDVGPSPASPSASVTAPQEILNISASAPPVSNTKGSRTVIAAGVEAPAPHVKWPVATDRSRRCTKCNKTGHNRASCGREPPQKRPKGRPFGTSRGKGTNKPRGGGRGSRGRGRGDRGRVSESEEEEEEDADSEGDVQEDDEQEDDEV